MEIVQYNNYWRRADVVRDPMNLYIFTDNTDRTSGSEFVPVDSWYYKKYGTPGIYLRFPNSTSAVIRGLPWAYPISTQRHYCPGDYGIGRWEDKDIEEFKEVIDSEILDILSAAPGYQRIIIPKGGIFRREISMIAPDRCPLIYDYLQEKTLWLSNLISLI